MFGKANANEQNNKECYICGKDASFICKECRKSICKIHVKFPIPKESKKDRNNHFCDICFQKLKNQKTHSFRRVIVALVVLIIVIALIIIIYELIF